MFTATKEQIAEWKKSHSKVVRLYTKNKDKCCYLHTPSRTQMSYISSVKDPIKFNEQLLNACWLAGDEELKTDDNLFMGMADKLSKLLEFEEFELEEL